MSATFIDTGLKAVDLFAPIPLGGNVLVTGEAKGGARVLGTELVHRLARRPGNPPKVVVFLDPRLPDVDAYEAEIRETVADTAEILRVDAVTSDLLRPRLSHRPFTLGNAVFAFSLDPDYLDVFHRAVRAGREAHLFTKLTAFAVTENGAREGYDARISMIRALASEAIFPAVDVRDTVSVATGLDRAAANHTRVAQSAREAIARVVDDLTPDSIQDESWAYHTDPAKLPALQALFFLSQPFFCAEPYTGMASAIVPVATTVENFRSILAGRYPGETATRFRFLNALDLPGKH